MIIKKSFSINTTDSELSLWDSQAQELNMTRNGYISYLANYNYLQGNRPLTIEQLTILWNRLPQKSFSNYTNDFKNKHIGLPENISRYILRFFYDTLSIPNLFISTNQNANFYLKNKQNFFCFYAQGDYKNISVDNYLESLKVTSQLIGPIKGNPNEYVYFARMQSFKHPSVISPYFDSICKQLSLPSVDCVKTHYTCLNSIAVAFGNTLKGVVA